MRTLEATIFYLYIKIPSIMFVMKDIYKLSSVTDIINLIVKSSLENLI